MIAAMNDMTNTVRAGYQIGKSQGLKSGIRALGGSSGSSYGIAGSVINSVVLIVVGLALFPLVLDFSGQAQDDPNASATDALVAAIIPTLYLLALLVAVLNTMGMSIGGRQ